MHQESSERQFVTVPAVNKIKYPSTEWDVFIMWYVYTLEYYTEMKNEQTTAWMSLTYIMSSKGTMPKR